MIALDPNATSSSSSSVILCLCRLKTTHMCCEDTRRLTPRPRVSCWISSICDILCFSTVITQRWRATPSHSPATVCLLSCPNSLSLPPPPHFFFLPPALMYHTLTRGTELAPIQPIVNEADDILMANKLLLKDKLSTGNKLRYSFLSLSLSSPPSLTALTHTRSVLAGPWQFVASKKVDTHTWQLRQR